MRIAICGTRGIPACYGGFETFAEELSTRLVARGHKVRVYGRSHVIDYSAPEYRGVEIKLLPTLRHKYLDTPVHGLLSFLHLLKAPVDVALICNAANSPFAWIPKLRGIPLAINVDGIERQRAKWNALGRAWYLLGERCSMWFANRVISDAAVIARYFRETYQQETTLIRYGFRLAREDMVELKLRDGARFAAELAQSDEALFAELGVSPGQYLLYVSRLEPENNAHVAIKAFQGLPKELRSAYPLVVVGDAPYATEYIRSLHALGGDEVRFAGFRFGEQYTTLQLGARAYIQATEVGGTHPALVESMGFANCILANDTPEHEEVIGEAGILYERNSPESLQKRLLSLVSDDEALSTYRHAARARAMREFHWERVVTQYEQLFEELLGGEFLSDGTQGNEHPFESAARRL